MKNILSNLLKIKQHKPKISIVIPCYNVERFLPDLFSYLQNQTFQDFEIIFVDDKSSDNTVQILEEYKKQNDNRVTLIKLPDNNGAGYARNMGLKYIKGKYTIFLDADDIYMPNLLEEVYKAAEKNNTDITMFKSICFDDKTKEYSKEDIWWLWTPPFPINKKFTPRDVQDKLFTFCKGALWNKLYKTSFIKKNKFRFLNIRKHNDSFFCYSAYVVAKSMFILDKVLIAYRINLDTSITTLGKKIDNKCTKISIDELEKFLKSKHVYKKYNKALLEYKRTH